MAEWNSFRDGKLASGRLIFDTAAMAALMPAPDARDAQQALEWLRTVLPAPAPGTGGGRGPGAGRGRRRRRVRADRTGQELEEALRALRRWGVGFLADPAADGSAQQDFEQLIRAGTGKPFAPAGRTFREWVLVDDRDQARWAELIDEALAFASG